MYYAVSWFFKVTVQCKAVRKSAGLGVSSKTDRLKIFVAFLAKELVFVDGGTKKSIASHVTRRKMSCRGQKLDASKAARK